MNTKAIVLAAVLAALACAAAVPTCSPSVGGAPDKHPQWEYKCVNVDEVAGRDSTAAGIERVLNDNYGQNGWELCTFWPNGWVFKRLKK
jgi:hypothetical protein